MHAREKSTDKGMGDAKEWAQPGRSGDKLKAGRGEKKRRERQHNDEEKRRKVS